MARVTLSGARTETFSPGRRLQRRPRRTGRPGRPDLAAAPADPTTALLAAKPKPTPPPADTATALAISVLRQENPDLPIFGVEPAVKPAAADSLKVQAQQLVQAVAVFRLAETDAPARAHPTAPVGRQPRLAAT